MQMLIILLYLGLLEFCNNGCAPFRPLEILLSLVWHIYSRAIKV
jgi:hypothetical protein